MEVSFAAGAVAAVLALIVLALASYTVYLTRTFNERLAMIRELADAEITRVKFEAEERVTRSKTVQRAVHVGNAAEQFAPYLPNFPGQPTEARHLGSPIDYLVFDGLEDDESEITVIFVEVKASKMRMLSKREQRVRDAINARRVRWLMYDVRREIG